MYDFDCASAIDIINAGIEEKQIIGKIVSYAIKQLTGEYNGTYEDFAGLLDKSMGNTTSEITFDEANNIADKIMARKGKK